jgi:hypothetical protein
MSRSQQSDVSREGLFRGLVIGWIVALIALAASIFLKVFGGALFMGEGIAALAETILLLIGTSLFLVTYLGLILFGAWRPRDPGSEKLRNYEEEWDQ